MASNANAAILANWKAMSNAATTGVSNASWNKKFSNANNQKGMRSLQAPQKSKNNTQRNMSAASKLAFRKSRRRNARKSRKAKKSRKN
jgi:hypothetical protein